MKIVPASEKDIDLIITWVTSEEDCRIWAGPLVTFPLEKTLLISDISFKTDNSFVCKHGDELLAFGQIFKLDTGYSHMARIITHPEFRGRGFGRQICSALVSFASDLGGDGVSLKVYRNNFPALRLYKSLGFNELFEKSDESIAFMVKT